MDAAIRPADTKRAITTVAQRPRTAASQVARGVSAAAFATVALAISSGLAVSLPALVACGVFVLATFTGAQLWKRRIHDGVVRDLLAAQDELLRDDVSSAETRMARVTNARAEPINRAEAVALMGACAVRRGEFERAAAFYASTLAIVPANRVRSIDAVHIASIARAQRAFALAATGHLDEAASILKLPEMAGAHPAARALAVRAEIVLHHRRGDAETVRAWIDANRTVIQNFLTQRDRALIRVIETLAHGATDERVAVRREIVPWIESVVPDAASAMVAV